MHRRHLKIYTDIAKWGFYCIVFSIYLFLESFKVQQAFKLAHTSAHFCHTFVTLMATFGRRRGIRHCGSCAHLWVLCTCVGPVRVVPCMPACAKRGASNLLACLSLLGALKVSFMSAARSPQSTDPKFAMHGKDHAFHHLRKKHCETIGRLLGSGCVSACSRPPHPNFWCFWSSKTVQIYFFIWDLITIEATLSVVKMVEREINGKALIDSNQKKCAIVVPCALTRER